MNNTIAYLTVYLFGHIMWIYDPAIVMGGLFCILLLIYKEI